jgi:hypothetical protein
MLSLVLEWNEGAAKQFAAQGDRPFAAAQGDTWARADEETSQDAALAFLIIHISF